ncbi:unnamed protein product [Albugo candida]|uniref:Peptidase A1 domain-containing protein n=1 Tax=Albugo candida TaxID=65357 RepID=A0A024GPQ8_9STRA|nr:unnamed protein product [Albugo candida]|eukprot:CCI48862.1 unnamed protein product [Albugo candida]
MEKCSIQFGGIEYKDQRVTVELGNEVTLIPTSKSKKFWDIFKEKVRDPKLEDGRYQGECASLVAYIKTSKPFHGDQLALYIFFSDHTLKHNPPQSFVRNGDTCTLLIEDSKKDDNDWILGSSILRSYQIVINTANHPYTYLLVEDNTVNIAEEYDLDLKEESG